MLKTLYNDLDITFITDDATINAINIIFERFERIVPAHSHGNNCYEIHYISSGYGTLQIDDTYYNLSPNTLFITGPHIVHAQMPISDNPMEEYCIYIKIKQDSHSHKIPSIVQAFTSMPFWIGKDTQGIDILMKTLFQELACHYTGYQNQVKLLLQQLLIFIVRNYEQNLPGLSSPFAPQTLDKSHSLIIDEYFLYEYQNLSLEALADRLKLSARQTQRLLMNTFGKTFQQKKAEARMSAAAILLSNYDQSITSIADSLGYSSAEHFSSAFKKYYQMTPREFRKKFCH